MELNRPRPFPPHLEPMLNGSHEVVVADLGAGPFSLVGTVHDTVKVRVVASDLLADEFNEMLAHAGIVPVVPVEKQDMERLTYDDESFDIVHCVNALDHVEDPRLALEEMHRVCKPGGSIYLKHFKNTGEANGYGGFHRWNISIVDLIGRCLIWNRETTYWPNAQFISRYERYDRRQAIVSMMRKE
jgi:ubiquinone/menaquinone biosynthesis C-methylase UbiE